MREFATLREYIFRYKWALLGGFIALVFVDGFQLVIPRITKAAIDALSYGNATSALLLRYGLYILGLSLGVGIMRFFWRLAIIGMSRKIEFDLRNRFYETVLSQSDRYFNNTKVGDLMALATNDLNAVRMMTGMAIVAAFDAFLMLIASLLMLGLINWKLTLWILIPMPFLSIIIIKFGKQLHDRFKAVQDSFASLTDKAQETYSGIRVIKAYVQEKGERERFEELNQDYVGKNMYLVRIWGMFDPLIGFVVGISFALVLLLGGDRVILGNMSMGDFVAFNAYLGIAIWPMIAIGWITNLYQRGKASMGRLNKVFNHTPEIKEINNPVILDNLEGCIEFKDLTFSYDVNTEPVLKNVSFKVKPGQTVAVIGRTGSGKTTLLKLIPRLFEVPDNSVFIDGHDVKTLQLKSLRKNIGIVPQDSFLFSETIIDNIKFGKPEIDDEHAIRCAKIAQIHNEILNFPNGYKTMVGERGVTLSGGQKQRVALARALVVDPGILILDDSFSAVDTETEEKIIYELDKFMENRTTILISHRISTVKDADYIYVIDEGKIVEKGTHDKLLELNGIYADIDRRQKLERMLEN